MPKQSQFTFLIMSHIVVPLLKCFWILSFVIISIANQNHAKSYLPCNKSFYFIFFYLTGLLLLSLHFWRNMQSQLLHLLKHLMGFNGETNVQMGWLVPIVTLLKKKLQHIRVSSRFCVPLLDALLAAIEKRFGEMLIDSELIAATSLLPKLKTCWISYQCVLKLSLFWTDCYRP